VNGAYPGGSKKREDLEIENLVSSLKEVVGAALTPEETAALKPATFRHTGAFVVLISILGALAAAAAITLALHSRAKEKSMLLPVESEQVASCNLYLRREKGQWRVARVSVGYIS
jgi:hypothetical protein